MEKHVEFSVSASYSTLGELTNKTQDIWIVCHGYGQMAKHFIRRFDVFDSEKTFVIAPQGLSKFYLDKEYQQVGASWMTKENRETELENQRNYIDAVLQQALGKNSLSNYRIHLLGFSQGVSMICRMAAYKKIDFTTIVLWAGGFPNELSNVDFQHVSPAASFKVVIGLHDEMIPQNDLFTVSVKKAEMALGIKADIITFDGKHEMNREVLLNLMKE